MSGAREIRVGFDADTLLRMVPVDDSFHELEVVVVGRSSSPRDLRARLAIAWAALRARHGGSGFALLSAEEVRALVTAIGGDTTNETVEPDPALGGADRYASLGTCSDGCAVHVRASAPCEDEEGWISVDFLSPPSVRRDCSLRGRLRNALAALAGRYDWTAWDPITEPAGLLAVLDDARAVAFPGPGPRGEI